MLKPWLVASMLLALVVAATGQDRATTAADLTDAQIEDFLLHAKVIKQHRAGKGITGTVRATLTDGTLIHDAHIQSIEEYREEFVGQRGTEKNFRDAWEYNVAAYRLDRLIGLNMVPVSVSRSWGGHSVAFTWWVDDVQMDEEKRFKEHVSAPDTEKWNRQMQMVRVFDQLIGNSDRNLGNLLITNGWRIWAIDHTRAFRLAPNLLAPQNVTRCDRQVLERLKSLDKQSLQKAIGKYTFTTEIQALLSRRDEIVKLLSSKGPDALFDRD